MAATILFLYGLLIFCSTEYTLTGIILIIAGIMMGAKDETIKKLRRKNGVLRDKLKELETPENTE